MVAFEPARLAARLRLSPVRGRPGTRLARYACNFLETAFENIHAKSKSQRTLTRAWRSPRLLVLNEALCVETNAAKLQSRKPTIAGHFLNAGPT